jgi:hypothetical protein
MIGIADPKLWNLGVGLLSKWSSLTFSFFLFTIHGFLNKVCPARSRIAEQVLVA